MRITTALMLATLVAACGGKLAPTPTATSGGDGATVGRGGGAAGDAGVSPPSGFDSDASIVFDDAGSAGFPPVPDGPSDTSPECSTRPASECCSGEGDTCANDVAAAVAEILHDCQTEVSYCGYAYVDLDAEGCAYALRLGEASPKFSACVTTLLDSTRFACIDAPVELEGYLDCTSR